MAANKDIAKTLTNRLINFDPTNQRADVTTVSPEGSW